MNEVNNSGWYALLKYKSGGTTDILPVHKIRVKLGKGEREAFNPKSLTDFDKTKYYTVHTAHGSNDGKEHKWYALIGLLAESREALEHAMNTKRISWPVILGEDESEPNTSDNNVELQRSVPLNETIISNRDSNINKKKTKKAATDAIYEKLLTSRSLNNSNAYDDASVSVTDDNIVARLLRENKELKSVLKAEQNTKKSSGDRDYMNTFQECLQRIEEKVGQMQHDFKQKLIELETKVTNIDDSISKFSQPYPQYVQHWFDNLPEDKNIEN